MSAPITSLGDVLDAALAKFCGECGGPLDPPGSQCGGCGALPSETRAEAAERLAAEPDPVARAEAQRLREEAAGMVAAAHRMLRDADAEEHRSVLRKARDAAEARLDAASAGLEGAEEALELAVRAEEVAAGPFADAYQVHQQAVTGVEEARRLRRGAAAEVEASVRLEAAAAVLARYRDEAHAATQGRKDAESVLEAVEAEIGEREREVAAAQAALERCAPVPLGGETVLRLFAPLARMAMGHDIDGRALDESERGMVGVLGEALRDAALAEYASALDKAQEDRIRARLEEEKRSRPQVRTTGDGQVSVGWLNAPKPSGRGPAGGVVTPAPRLSPASPLSGAPGFPGIGK